MRDDVFKISGTTHAQRTSWRAAAGGGSRDLSAWLRWVADRASTTDPARFIGEIEATQAMTKSLVELRSALGSGPGNTLNQIARAMNTTNRAGQAPDAAPHERSMAQAYAEIQAIRAALNVALDGLNRHSHP
jgi:hypothetical protein